MYIESLWGKGLNPNGPVLEINLIFQSSVKFADAIIVKINIARHKIYRHNYSLLSSPFKHIPNNLKISMMLKMKWKGENVGAQHIFHF